MSIIPTQADAKDFPAYENMVAERMRKYGATREVVERAVKAFCTTNPDDDPIAYADSHLARDNGNSTMDDYLRYFAQRECEDKAYRQYLSGYQSRDASFTFENDPILHALKVFASAGRELSDLWSGLRDDGNHPIVTCGKYSFGDEDFVNGIDCAIGEWCEAAYERAEKSVLSEVKPTQMTAHEASEIVRTCVARIGAGYHPDTPFSEYVEDATGRPIDPSIFPCTQVQHDEAMDVLGAEAYSIGLDEFNKLYPLV